MSKESQEQSIFSSFKFALAFLTLLPVVSKTLVSKKNMANSLCFFAFVGLVFAGLNYLCFWAFNFHESTWVLALSILVLNTLLSGGLHLDALMDSFDGLAVSDRDQAEIQRVMKDSRVGAFGVIGLVFVLACQFIFIAQSFYDSFLYTYLLCLVPVFSRLLLVLELVFFVDKEKLDAKSSLQTFLGFDFSKVVTFNTLTLLVLILVYSGVKICIVVFVVIALILSIVLYRFLKFKLKGQNGDSLGCGLVLNEAIMYFLIFVFSNVLT